MRVLPNLICFSFSLANDQKSFNAACNNIILHFCAANMDFFILKFQVFFLLITLQEEFPPIKHHLCWICTSNKNKTLLTINVGFSAIFCNLLWSKFWNHFQAEIILSSPLLFYFLKAFYMVWKCQESCESWLVGFWVSRRSKMPKISVNNFFAFLSCHYRFT